MNYLTQQLLNAEEINQINNDLENETQNWEDGKKTAGSHASIVKNNLQLNSCLLYTSPSPRDLKLSRMPSSA